MKTRIYAAPAVKGLITMSYGTIYPCAFLSENYHDF